MNKYRVWSKNHDNENDAITLDAVDAKSAALQWAKIQSNAMGWFEDGEKDTVFILDQHKKTFVYTVYAKYVQNFYAYEGEQK